MISGTSSNSPSLAGMLLPGHATQVSSGVDSIEGVAMHSYWKSAKSPILVAVMFISLLTFVGVHPLHSDPAATSLVPRHMRLPNGLEVFAVEDHTVPLATVCIVFRGGASVQDPSTAGLFHLYEHMLFAGNERYPTQAAFTAALNRLGSPSWNGATGGDYIKYYITIPSSRLSEGIEFWSWAIRHPVFEPAKLEREKQVVINEIAGYHADPAQIASNALSSRLFSTYPWRKNIEGPEFLIEKATPEDLEAMRATWYVPGNAALIVSGDIDPEAVFRHASTWFGDWKGSTLTAQDTSPHPPFASDVRLVSSEPGYYNGIAGIEFRWRGPDVMSQTQDTYAADILLYLLSSPSGRFKSTLMEKATSLYDAEYIGFTYPTARDGGEFIFSAYMKTAASGGETLVDKVESLRSVVLSEFELMAGNPVSYFGDEALIQARTKLVDQNLLSMERARSFATDTLAFWWAVATTDYFFTYEEQCLQVSWSDISGLIDKYFGTRPTGTLLRVRSSAWNQALTDKAGLLGYEMINPAKAFWWQRDGGMR